MADRFHQIILFNDANFEGEHKHVFRSVAYLDDFNDRASSFAVLAGSWQLLRDHEFRAAEGSIFAPRIRGYHWVEAYDLGDNETSSVRLVDEDRRVVPHLILFADQGFGGAHKHVFDALDATANWTHAGSLVIFAGSWDFDLANGSTVTLNPGVYPLSTQNLSAAIRHVQLKDAGVSGAQISHLVVFDRAHFKGPHRHLFGSLATLGEWNGLVSSFVIERGSWRMFASESFLDTEGQLLTRGIYPWVEDYDIQNDRIRSVRLESAAPSPPALVTPANVNDGVNILTAHGDDYRLGWNAHETRLTPRSVRVPYFGLLWRGDILDQNRHPARVYGQPLYISNAPSPTGVTQ
jgi:hypothetical protein